jgi:Rod binding domain-containing protein
LPITDINGRPFAFSAHGGMGAGKVDEKRLEKACQEFESLFIHQMMKTMRQTVPRTGFMGEGKERNIFQALFDEEISKAISKRGGMGLGKMLYQQMQKRGGEGLLRKETLNNNEGLEKRDGSLISASRSGGFKLSPADQRDKGRGEMPAGRGDRIADPVGQGD